MPMTGLAQFECGNPYNYHGRTYETVLIGNQCWFGENLRTTQYYNGDAIQLPEPMSNADWMGLTTGATCIYGDDPETDYTIEILGTIRGL